MKKVTINLYSLHELNPDAKQFAIEQHICFMDDIGETFENEEGIMVTEFPEHTEEEAIDNIEVNGYLYYGNGELADCITYTGKHPKAGTTEFRIHGDTYIIE